MKLMTGQKECLKWQNPFHVYFGRRRNCNGRHNLSADCREDTVDRRLIMCSTVRRAAKEATQHCDMRRNKFMMKNLITPLYHVGERVLIAPPAVAGPYPRTPPRKLDGRGRRRGKTITATDTPEKIFRKPLNRPRNAQRQTPKANAS